MVQIRSKGELRVKMKRTVSCVSVCVCVCVSLVCVISSARHYVKKECSIEKKEKISLIFSQNQYYVV